ETGKPRIEGIERNSILSIRLAYGAVEIGFPGFGTNKVPSHVKSRTVWFDLEIGDTVPRAIGGKIDWIVAIVSVPAVALPAESLTSSLPLRSIEGSVAGNPEASTFRATRRRVMVLPIGAVMLGTKPLTKAYTALTPTPRICMEPS